MTNFIRAANPIWWIPDLTGFPLNDEYYAFFLTNDLPYIFEPVYQDINGINPWPAPLQFQPAGTLPNNLYFDETKTYRIEIRHGNSSADQLIYLIENFVPGNNVNTSNTSLLIANNMITNPQFADIYFSTIPPAANPIFTYVQAVGGTYSVDIGPGWRIDLEGTGSLTVSQFPISGFDDSFSTITGNPNYFIRINNTGWTSIKLVQRFSNNGAIFGSGAVALAFTAQATGSSQPLTVQYVPSNSVSPPTPIFAGSIATGALTAYGNSVNIPASSNNDLDGDAFVDITFVLPVGSDLSFTNIQLVGQSTNLPSSFNPATDTPTYREQTYERTVDQEFNTYKSWLFYKQIPSLLTGWDFPLNPAQFEGRSFAAKNLGAVNKSYYAWDQTILFQSANNGITVSSPASNDLTLTAAVTTQMAIIQYLDQTQARKALSDKLAVNISATSTTASNNGIVCTASLWYTTDVTLPDIKSPNFNSIVLTLDANGKPATFNGTWTEVSRLTQQNATFTIGNPPAGKPSEYNDYNFMGWDLQGDPAVNTATFFAIVIGTASVTAADSLHLNSVGMMNGNIATRPAPQTLDEVLTECQFYYEKSYENDITAGQISLSNARSIILTNNSFSSVNPTGFWGIIFNVEYNTQKRINAIHTMYSPNIVSAGDTIRGYSIINGNTPVQVDVSFSSFYPSQVLGKKSFSSGEPNTVLVMSNPHIPQNQVFGIFSYHYVADARLGI